jgi:hypothetical protein
MAVPPVPLKPIVEAIDDMWEAGLRRLERPRS